MKCFFSFSFDKKKDLTYKVSLNSFFWLASKSSSLAVRTRLVVGTVNWEQRKNNHKNILQFPA